MAGNSTSGQLNRLHAELDELSGRNGVRPPSIGEALAAATEAVQRRQATARAMAEAGRGFSKVRAAAMAAAGIGGWLATRPRRKQPAVRKSRLPGIGAVAMAGVAAGSAWLALRRR